MECFLLFPALAEPFGGLLLHGPATLLITSSSVFCDGERLAGVGVLLGGLCSEQRDGLPRKCLATQAKENGLRYSDKNVTGKPEERWS